MFLYLVEIFILDQGFKGIGLCWQGGHGQEAERGHSSAWLAVTLFSLFCPQAHDRVPSTWCVDLLPSVNIVWKCLSRQTKEVHLTSILSDWELAVKIDHYCT